ncbi:hypothetical protein [Thaumasiovibrio sp. DFM-14]|uniref:hypothetical protein n=1 Tax=Thaumasiovibrio sp. DFM-14 TaxID=3384792 RepID=UPI0039A3DF2E
MAFDEAFLVEQQLKRERWNAAGKRTGNGGRFSTKFGNTTKAIKPAHKESFPSAGGVTRSRVVLDPDLPSWLAKIVSTDKEVMRGLSDKSYRIESPHKQAMVWLAKDLTLLKSNEEHYIQVRLFYTVEIELPDVYEVMFSIPNGGLRSKKTAGKLKAEGQRAGYPDIAIDTARAGYFGYRLEVKTESGKMSATQKGWSKKLNKNGYLSETRYGFDDCMSGIRDYASKGPTCAIETE